MFKLVVVYIQYSGGPLFLDDEVNVSLVVFVFKIILYVVSLCRWRSDTIRRGTLGDINKN